MSKKMLKVIGIGNILCGDDGIGPVIIQQMEKEAAPDFIKLIDAGSDAFTILDQLLQPEPVIVIDCAKMGSKPGSIHMVSVKDSDYIDKNLGISLHGFSLAEVWQLAQSIGKTGDFSIIGVEPKKIEFNSGLSEEVKNSIPTVVKIVVEEAKKYAEKDSHH